MTAYYNEIDPFAAEWLRQLISAGHIAPGIVDDRSIEDVRPDDLRGFTQCHFFAGIGGWSHALRLAGWPDNEPVWTASCPCQPFSQAGEGAGFNDERHLWPSLQWLITESKPGIIIGEQVASKAANPWLDLVQADLEAMDYAFGAVAFPSASVGAPHIRDRAYWVADSDSERLERGRADSYTKGRQGPDFQQAGLCNSFWSGAEWVACKDGRKRPVEPGASPLADGVPARVGRLRGYGNAINTHQAKTFIEALSVNSKEI